MATIKKICKNGVCYDMPEGGGTPITSVNVDYEEDGGSPDASAEYEDGELSFSLKNMKMKFSELTSAEKAALKGDTGDSAVYDPNDPDAPDFVMANATGTSTTKAMTQKAVTDAINAVIMEVIEDGFYIVDEYGYIGFYVGATGAHASNIVEFKN